eukprot:scaffold166946_cov18-Tisochrysis_lutea.AAC.1
MSTWRQQQQQSRRVTAARARLWQEGGGQKGSTARPSALPLQQGALRGRQQVLAAKACVLDLCVRGPANLACLQCIKAASPRCAAGHAQQQGVICRCLWLMLVSPLETVLAHGVAKLPAFMSRKGSAWTPAERANACLLVMLQKRVAQ